jgi:hypothetical protein
MQLSEIFFLMLMLIFLQKANVIGLTFVVSCNVDNLRCQ